ncbi:MAG: helicase C-terminal domain-containing protein [Caldilineaceae bacterium]
MTGRVYVALDLETTGLDAKRDQIIEIGAVCFQGDHILDRFVTYVNPARTIPLRVQQMTGIRNSDIADAPTLADIAPELLAFVRSDVVAIVAHNASFDIGFLRAAGIQFHRPILDTFELATILLPTMSSYSLGALCQSLSISMTQAHRALTDAEAAAQLFMVLRQRLYSLPSATLYTILESGEGADWPPLMLFEAAVQPSLFDRTGPREQWPAPPTPGYTRFIDITTPLPDDYPIQQQVEASVIEHFFAADGPLAQQFGPGYEARSGQVQMAQQVVQALNRGDHLLVEAGTGTGKSLAYLMPAALWSVANHRRVVIATNTIPLQEQLLNREIPRLQQLLHQSGQPAPQAALLKGRNNYLCTRRLHAWRTSRRLSAAELTLLAKVLIWLPHTTTGDVSELFLASPVERALWQQICSDQATCTPERCGGQHTHHTTTTQTGADASTTGDFFYHAHQQAERAHLLIVNHALLIADLATGGRVLPPYSHLIVDEAHRLDEAATTQLTYRLEWPWVLALLQRLSAEGRLLPHLRRLGQADEVIERVTRALPHSAARVEAALPGFRERLLYFAQHQNEVRRDAGYTQQLYLNSAKRTQAQWGQIELEWDQLRTTLQVIQEQLAQLIQRLTALQWWHTEPYAIALSEVQSMGAQLQEVVAQMDSIIWQDGGGDAEHKVTWLEINEAGTDVSLLVAPLYVNEILEKSLVLQQRTIVLTGATLRTGSGFSFMRERLGLWHATTFTVDSPFDYQQSVLLYMPRDLPMPDHPRYQQAVERAIIDAALATGGRSLALFTSYAQLRATAEAIRSELDRAGITVLEHGASSRSRLLREYRRLDKAVLLGTRSFWEGVDLPGDELQCLLIVRLPFAVPSDPVVAARCAELENSFSDYMLPDAILRFRQGFGRLIRRTTDRGVVVLLDSRLWRKEYGSAFLESLPTCTTSQAPLANLGEEITNWLF